MPYLQPSDYEAFSLSADSPDAFIRTASTLIDAHCRRASLFATTYTERPRLMAGTQSVRLSYGPLAPGAVTALRVRYGSMRRGELLQDFSTQVAQAFSLPGSWSTLDVTNLDLNLAARELTLPANWMGLGYNEAEVTYTAGFVTVPDAVKAACAQIVRNAEATPALNVQRSRVDTMQLQYFAPTLLDADVRALLKPYVAERL